VVEPRQIFIRSNTLENIQNDLPDLICRHQRVLKILCCGKSVFFDYFSEEFTEKPAPTRASFGKFPGRAGVQPVFSLKNRHSTQPFPARQPNLCIS
ncbi:MAG: hypothetical protein ACKPJD_19210, partial [Planctomycetaceae bacterium]